MYEQIIFWILAAVAVGSALGVVLMKNPVNNIMALLLAMFAIAGLYVLMGAHLVALFQVIIYIGAVLVLFLFVMMLLDLKAPQQKSASRPGAFVVGAFALLLTAGTIGMAWYAVMLSGMWRRGGKLLPEAGLKEIAVDLFIRHTLVFELTSALLFVAAVGAILISRKEDDRHES
jgi:NADH-quinone oxidoreductase subunit J